ncbi:MAG: flagellin, partial [Pseudomonadota bacterium]
LAVEEGVSVDGGPLASEIGARLLAELGDLADAQATLGSFSGELSAAQRDLLVEKIATFDAIAAELTRELGLNGVAQGQASEAINRGAAARDLAEIVASEIEDADLAEVVARLNQDQLAIQASAQALSTATQLSLLNFL